MEVAKQAQKDFSWVTSEHLGTLLIQSQSQKDPSTLRVKDDPEFEKNSDFQDYFESQHVVTQYGVGKITKINLEDKTFEVELKDFKKKSQKTAKDKKSPEDKKEDKPKTKKKSKKAKKEEEPKKEDQPEKEKEEEVAHIEKVQKFTLKKDEICPYITLRFKLHQSNNQQLVIKDYSYETATVGEVVTSFQDANIWGQMILLYKGDKLLDPKSEKHIYELDFQNDEELNCLVLTAMDFHHVHLFNSVQVKSQKPVWNGMMGSRDFYLSGFGIMGLYHIDNGTKALVVDIEVYNSSSKQTRLVEIDEEPDYQKGEGMIDFYFSHPVLCQADDVVNFKIKKYTQGSSNSLVCQSDRYFGTDGTKFTLSNTGVNFFACLYYI